MIAMLRIRPTTRYGECLIAPRVQPLGIEPDPLSAFQDEGRCRTLAQVPLERAVSGSTATGGVPLALPQRRGPMALTRRRAGLLSGHKPVGGRTVRRLQSAHDTSGGESASVLLSHGADCRWNSCSRMSDWCHGNAITLGERRPS